MFWKVVGGIFAFMAAVFVGIMLMAVAGVATVGAVVGSAVENLDVQTVQITDSEGRTETINLDELNFENGRLEINGAEGDQVRIDLDIPQIEVQERGRDGTRVVIGDGESIIEIDENGPEVRFNGREINDVRVNVDGFDFDGRHAFRPIAWFFAGLFRLMAVGLILVGGWMLLRNRNSGGGSGSGNGGSSHDEADLPKEKGPELAS